MSHATLEKVAQSYVEEWRGILAPFTISVALGAFSLGLPLLLQHRYGADELDLSWLNAFSAVIYLVGAPLCGRLADRGWRSKLLISAPLVALLGAMAMLFIRDFWHCYVAVFLIQLSCAMFFPSLITTMCQTRHPTRALRRIVVFSVAGTVGFCIGQQIGGALRDLDPRWPFLGCGIVSLILLPIAAHSDRHHSAPERLESSHGVDLGLPNRVRQRWFLWMAWIGDMAAVGCLVVTHVYFPLMGVRLGLSGSFIGFLVLLSGVSPAIGYVVFGFLPKWWYYRVWPLLLIESAGIAGCLLLGFCTHASLLGLAMLCVGLGTTLSYLASTVYGVVGSDGPGANSGLHEGLLGGSCAVLPLIAGQSVRFWGGDTPYYPSTYFTAAGFLTVAILVQIGIACYVVRAEKTLKSVAPIAPAELES